MVREVPDAEIEQETLEFIKDKIADFRGRKVYGRLIFEFRAGVIYSMESFEKTLPKGGGSGPRKTLKKKQENTGQTPIPC